jgi:hypothetical protein
MGGLGNQLFQICTTISYSIRTKNIFKFLNVHMLNNGASTIRYTFWNSFLSNFKLFLIDNIPENIEIIKETDHSFNELPITNMINKDCLLFGYFQSHKYFQEHFDIICKIIEINKLKYELKNKISINNYLDNSISMHFRIGDYKKLQLYHPVLNNIYYYNSLKFIKEKNPETKFNIIYFYEDDDIKDVLPTIDYLKKEFNDYNFIPKEDNLEDWEQMLLMSCCNHNIIANSTFSWWGAYFNESSSKLVCYPSIWFGPSASLNTDDLYPEDWNKINAV